MFPPPTCSSCKCLIGNVIELFYMLKRQTKLSDKVILQMLGVKYDCCNIEIRTSVNLISL
jgi:DNA-directed RNA polymerase subunit N (RpoN/RPB10)